MTVSPIKQPLALIPIAMSLAAIAVLLLHISRFGIAPEPDEGTSAHIWQLLMAGQLPVIALFLAMWLPRAPRQTLVMLAVQLGFALAALAPVYWLGL